MAKKTPLQKFLTHAQPEIKEGPEEWNLRYGGTKMLISSPQAIADVLVSIPRGKVMNMTELRDKLAEAYHADYTCPLTTGIFLRIVAEANQEIVINDEKAAQWPYWRIIRDNNELIDKFPGGIAAPAALLEAEGHSIMAKGKKLFCQSN